MLLKVTLNFSIYCAVILFCGCREAEKPPTELEVQHIKDSVSEARIDSAYVLIKSQCDTLMVYQVPKMVDSLLKDSALLQKFFDGTKLYTDADKKVEKVIRQLQADCDSNLLQKTYKTAQLKLRSGSGQHKKK